MKVRSLTPFARAAVRLSIALAVLAPAVLSAPAQAQAITRKQILARGRTWVVKKVGYSQSRHYRGYRRDCSGFVSMAWKLKRSYTTRTIHKRATRVRISQLKPGDAVLTRGHVAIFAGWKNKKKRTYYAMEETTWGSHAKRQVRKIPRGAKGLRRKGLTEAPRRVATKPASPASQPVATTTALSVPLTVYSGSESSCQSAQAVEVALALDNG